MNKKNGIKQEINLINLIEKYQKEDDSRAYLEGLRWPNGAYFAEIGHLFRSKSAACSD